MDWYWLILMRCSSIFGLVVVLVLIILGLTSSPLRLLYKEGGTILQVQGLGSTILHLWIVKLLIWKLDVVLKSREFWCLLSRWRRWSSRRCAGRRYCMSRDQQGKWGCWLVLSIWVPYCRRVRMLWVSCFISELRSCMSQGPRRGWLSAVSSHLWIRRPLNLLILYLST